MAWSWHGNRVLTYGTSTTQRAVQPSDQDIRALHGLTEHTFRLSKTIVAQVTQGSNPCPSARDFSGGSPGSTEVR